MRRGWRAGPPLRHARRSPGGRRAGRRRGRTPQSDSLERKAWGRWVRRRTHARVVPPGGHQPPVALATRRRCPDAGPVTPSFCYTWFSTRLNDTAADGATRLSVDSCTIGPVAGVFPGRRQTPPAPPGWAAAVRAAGASPRTGQRGGVHRAAALPCAPRACKPGGCGRGAWLSVPVTRLAPGGLIASGEGSRGAGAESEPWARARGPGSAGASTGPPRCRVRRGPASLAVVAGGRG